MLHCSKPAPHLSQSVTSLDPISFSAQDGPALGMNQDWVVKETVIYVMPAVFAAEVGSHAPKIKVSQETMHLIGPSVRCHLTDLKPPVFTCCQPHCGKALWLLQNL
ncbi:unnamed protein product [Eretmochelys imbricata]